MKAHISGMKTFSFGQDLAFEGYVQFKEYICFVKAMDALRGMKLLYKEGDKAHTANMKVIIFINHLSLHVNSFKPYGI
jgi:arginine/serine-rich splicing factor 17